MAPEQYIESIIMRKDNLPETLIPSFNDDDCDKEYEFEGKVQLVQIVKSVQNAVHNRHDYVFKIISIDKIEEQE